MYNMQRGFRGKLQAHLNPAQTVDVNMQMIGPAVYDFCCFGVDQNGKLSDDRYMLFYNQKSSPQNEIIFEQNQNVANFKVDLFRLPPGIQKLVFTVNIDGNGVMSQIQACNLEIRQPGANGFGLSMQGRDFQNETAIIVVEVYLKDEWRVSVVANGFNGGLSDLLKAYGGEEEAGSATTAPQANQAPQSQNAQPNQPAQSYASQNQQNQQGSWADQLNQLGQTLQSNQNTQQNQANQNASPMAGSSVIKGNVVGGESSTANPGVVKMDLPGSGNNYNSNSVNQNPGFASHSTLDQNFTNSFSQNREQNTNMQNSGGSNRSVVSLEKKLEQGAPALVSLAKPLQTALEESKLTGTIARVALVLDISGSMNRRYKNGTVQEIVNKTLPLAVQFDDDGELDFWYYGSTPKRMASVNMQNYMQAVPSDHRGLMRELGGMNNEPAVMRLIIDEYRTSRLPAYVLFITDGGVSSEREIKDLLTEASRYPIFWQFVGVGGSNYGILKRLDTMTGRYVDNASFFALDDFKKVENTELYRRLLKEFPHWIEDIKMRGMI